MEKLFMLAFDRPEIADTRADVGADHISVRLIDLETTVLHGFVRRCERKMCERTHPSRFLLVEKAQRVKILYLTGKLDREFFGVESLDVIRTALATHKSAPRRRNVVSDRRYQTEPCDYYSSSHRRRSLFVDRCSLEDLQPRTTINEQPLTN